MSPRTRLSAPPSAPGTGRARSLVPALALALVAGCGSERRPDLHLVVVDTLRADRLACYGYPRPTSPRMDRLAAEGVLFEDVTAQFSWTVPSMISMFTGRYLTDHTEEVGAGEVTLASALAEAGYVTLGASANLLIQADTGLLEGFHAFDALGLDGPRERGFAELGASLLAMADEHLDSADRPPLFLYLHALEPHDPYHRFPPADAELPTREAVGVEPFGWRVAELEPHAGLAPESDPLWGRELDWIARARGRYDHEVRAVDEALDAWLDELEARGLLEHAVVAVVSDHGEGLWDHAAPEWIRERALADEDLHARLPRELFYQKHGAIQYQEVLATPMILWGSGLPRGLRIETPVENVDLLPTLLALADVPLPSGVHGRSLAEGLERGRLEPPAFVHALGVQGATVREVASGLKLIVPRRKAAATGAEPELYALREDPHERSDLAPLRPDDVRRLMDVYETWRRDHPLEREARTGSRAAERTAEMRKRLAAIGYTGEESTGEDP